MDVATTEIRALEFPLSNNADSPVLRQSLKQSPDREEIGAVTADRAHDTRRCNAAIIDRRATAIIPIRKNRRP